MRDVVVALGLALAVEGILCASFPDAVKRAMMEAASSPRDRMRIVGVVSAAVGVLIVWAMRRYGG